MSDPIVYIDRSMIREGRLDDLKDAVDALVKFIDAREPQLLYYGFFINEEASRMTVVAVHPDSASLELHMEVGASAFRGFVDLIELDSIEVYGEPSDEVVERLREKAQALGETGGVAVRSWHAGFARFAVHAPTT